MYWAAAPCWNSDSRIRADVLRQIRRATSLFQIYSLRPARKLLREPGPPQPTGSMAGRTLSCHRFQASGSHQLKFGVDLERNAFHQAGDAARLRGAAQRLSVARYVTFAGSPVPGPQRISKARNTCRITGRPATDSLIEAGLRTDWDQIVRDVLWSPRLSVAYAPKWLRETETRGGLSAFSTTPSC